MLSTHSLRLSRDDFDYDYTPGFEMGVEREWHVIDPVDVLKDVDLYDSDLRKLHNDDRYAIRIFYKLVLPLTYFSDSGVSVNPLVDADGKFTFSNGLAIGNPTLKTHLSSKGFSDRGLFISDEVLKNNNNYSIPDEWALNHTYIKRDKFATGTSIAHLAVNHNNEIYIQPQTAQVYNIGEPEIIIGTHPYLFSSRLNQGGIASININDTNVAYTVTTEGNSINVPDGTTPVPYNGKKLMPLLFKPFGMSWCSDKDSDVIGWVYCILGVKQIMNEPTYTVKFIDWDGTVLKQQLVQEGTSATPPSNPVRDGYTFNGWLPNTYKDVFSNLDIYAQYTQNSPDPGPKPPVTGEAHTFVNGDGDICVSDIPLVSTGLANVEITFALPLDTIEFDLPIHVVEFSSGAGVKSNVSVNGNIVSFTDEDVSTLAFYAIQLYKDGNRVGQTAWDAGVIPTNIKFTLSDGSVVEFNITHSYF